jgi:hypothetical protein
MTEEQLFIVKFYFFTVSILFITVIAWYINLPFINILIHLSSLLSIISGLSIYNTNRQSIDRIFSTQNICIIVILFIIVIIYKISMTLIMITNLLNT